MSRFHKDRMLLFTILGAFALLLLFLAVLLAVFWNRWPIAAGLVFGSLMIHEVLSVFKRQIADARILGAMTPPKVAEVGEYIGRYCEHWEVPYILVWTGNRRFGFLRQFEKWFPEGGSALPPSTEATGATQHLVVFSGIVSESGRFGHRGMADRTVQVLVLTESSQWPNERSRLFSSGFFRKHPRQKKAAFSESKRKA